MIENTFEPLSLEEEMMILSMDTPAFTKTREYLKPLIEQVVQHHLPKARQAETIDLLIADVAIAAECFCEKYSLSNAPYKFSTYFTWYIEQRVNRK